MTTRRAAVGPTGRFTSDATVFTSDATVFTSAAAQRTFLTVDISALSKRAHETRLPAASGGCAEQEGILERIDLSGTHREGLFPGLETRGLESGILERVVADRKAGSETVECTDKVTLWHERKVAIVR